MGESRRERENAAHSQRGGFLPRSLALRGRATAIWLRHFVGLSVFALVSFVAAAVVARLLPSEWMVVPAVGWFVLLWLAGIWARARAKERVASLR